MARSHENTETWKIPSDKDQWESIRAADAYLRIRVGLKRRTNAMVFDERGNISEDTLHKCYEEWREESSPLKSVVCFYGDSTDPLSAQLHAKDLDHDPDVESAWLIPTIDVRVRGEDAAEVRGIALEAIEKAQQGIVVPPIPVPDIDLAAGGHHVRPAQPDVSPHLASPPSRLSVITSHQWFVGIVTGLIVAAIVAGVAWLW